MKNKMAGIVIGAVVIIGISFFVGMKYGEGIATTAKIVSMSGREGQFGGGRGARVGGGFVSGEILTKDNNGITIKDNNGGSKIVFLTSSTTIIKTSDGTLSDLIVGAQVTATGSSNSDGSINAQSIQIRPQRRVGASLGN